MKRSAHRLLRQVEGLRVASGMLDAGLGSIAGLAGSFYAARMLDIGQLGLFSLFFVMFQLLGLLPNRLLLVPAQVAALDLPAEHRPSLLARSLPLGLIAGLAALPLVWIVPLLAPGAARADYIAFGLTTSTMIVLSPLQDHCRFMLHMGQRSSAAALVSAIQLSVALIAIVGLHLSGVRAAWIPFLGLSLANAASLVFAIWLARPRGNVVGTVWPGVRGLLSSGRVLLPAQVLPVIGALGTAALVVRLASADDLGAAEAARTVASPIIVAGVGLGQVLYPRIMEAARQGDGAAERAAIRLFALLILAIGAAYIAVFGWSHPLNLAEAAIPAAFTVTGLVAFRVVAGGGTVLSGLPGTSLLALGDNRGLLLASAGAVLIQLATAFTLAEAIGAHAVPAAELSGAIVLAVVAVWRLRPARARRQAALSASG